MKQYYMSIDFFLNEKLSCRRETARCFVSLNISLRCGSRISFSISLTLTDAYFIRHYVHLSHGDNATALGEFALFECFCLNMFCALC